MSPALWFHKTTTAIVSIFKPVEEIPEISELLAKEEILLIRPNSPEKFGELSKVYRQIADAYQVKCEFFDFNTQVMSYAYMSQHAAARRLQMLKSDAIFDI